MKIGFIITVDHSDGILFCLQCILWKCHKL
jgi:hypothetical protein